MTTARGPRMTAGTDPHPAAPAPAWRAVLRAGVDLFLPTTCGGCELPGDAWCPRCAARLRDAPIARHPRVRPGVDVWALGPYRGPHRRAVVAVKEHGRRDLVDPLGAALALGVATLGRWGELPDTDRLWLVPAPTRPVAARRRGGDPVTAVARRCAELLGPAVDVAPVLYTASRTRDSAGLDARRRAANLDRAVRLRRRALLPEPGAAVVLIDDVLTTGATAAESVRVLAGRGVAVDAVLVIAAA